MIEKLSESQRVVFMPRGGQPQDLTQPQHSNTMRYEAQHFVELVSQRRSSIPDWRCRSAPRAG